MYSLFLRVDGIKRLCEEFKSKVNNFVTKIVHDQEREEEMVERLLDLKGFIDEALPEAFVNVSISDSSANVDVKPTKTVNLDFVHAASDAFQAGFRGRKLKPAEMIAKYLDRAMRKGQQNATTDDFNKIMQRVLGLYRYTQGGKFDALLIVNRTDDLIVSQTRMCLGLFIIKLWRDVSLHSAVHRTRPKNKY